MDNRDSIEWLSAMIEFSHLTDSKPMLAQIRAELRSLREQVRIHEDYARKVEALLIRGEQQEAA